MKILNAFSLNMLADFPASIQVVEISAADAAHMLARLGAESAVGHEDTAQVMTSILGTEVAFNRASVTLQRGEECLVGQLSGSRLPLGATELPPGATIKWLLVSIR
jgi:hypothetical protein